VHCDTWGSNFTWGSRIACRRSQVVFICNNFKANSEPLKDFYHTGDIFVLPTFGDCLPIVLWEAGASGMAIISMNVAAIPEVVRNGGTGLTVRAGDAASLTAHANCHYDAPTNASRSLGLLKAEASAARAERLAAPSERYV